MIGTVYGIAVNDEDTEGHPGAAPGMTFRQRELRP
ncbi:hypothetical protein ATK36_0224 [Amycolatopsis sulphurea]|uniref:Uncharacterized protein n=1 Tax=Amycolatopsis sulphurea TaxID=76022 RepID=A0A2A9FZ60_9PSEU|nr:hypothetical protein ATK36_0224 [Amycolatopsis sulphurea]